MIKAVILAAGWGIRMNPLTLTKPKPFLSIAGKSILEHNLDELQGLVEEVIIVIGYKGELIKRRLKENYKGLPIKYAIQEEQLGTGHAAKAALPFLEEKFLILNGDDLYAREDLLKCLEVNPSILLREVKDPSPFGQVLVDNGKVKDLVEKPEEPVSNLINTGVYFLNKDFFKKNIEKSQRGEYEITDYLKEFIKEGELYHRVAKRWDSVSYPWDVLRITKKILCDIKEERKGKIEEGAKIEGKVILKEGAVIEKGAKIKGPVYIGKNSRIKSGASIGEYSSLEDNCLIEENVHLERSLLGEGVQILSGVVVKDSIIGSGCVLGRGVLIASNRYRDTIRAEVKGKIIDTKRKGLGVILGDNVKVEEEVCFLPGVMVGSNCSISYRKVVDKNIPPNTKI